MIDTDDVTYFLARARQEAEAAAASAHPTAASAHRSLSMNYSAKALLAHVDADDGPGAFPQFTKAAARR